MKYPLDDQTINESVHHIVQHMNAQRLTITLLTGLLIEAMQDADDNQIDNEWYQESEKFLKLQQALKNDHANRIFDEDNLRKARGMLPKDRPKAPPALPESVARAVAPIPDRAPLPGGLPTDVFDAMADAATNKIEAEFGEEVSERELAAHFSEPQKRRQRRAEVIKSGKKDGLSGMTMEEIEAWEAKQNNSNDIYKIKARVANIARGGGGSLTEQGEMLCNTFVHVLKALYDFAENAIEDKTLRIRLIELIRKQEGMPGNLISAAGAGVKQSK